MFISITIVKLVIHRVNVSQSSSKQSEVKHSGLGQGVFTHDYTSGSVGARGRTKIVMKRVTDLSSNFIA